MFKASEMNTVIRERESKRERRKRGGREREERKGEAVQLF